VTSFCFVHHAVMLSAKFEQLPLVAQTETVPQKLLEKVQCTDGTYPSSNSDTKLVHMDPNTTIIIPETLR